MSDDYCHCGLQMDQHTLLRGCTTPVSMGAQPMSTVLMRREVPPVCFDADECGAVFATEAADVQAEFLKAWAATAYKFDWPQQCRMIADELDANDRVKAIGILAALLEHLREPVSDAIAFR